MDEYRDRKKIKMTDISKHPLLKQCYEVCIAIEECGASEKLTDASSLAGDLLTSIDLALAEHARDRLNLESVTKERDRLRAYGHALLDKIKELRK